MRDPIVVAVLAWFLAAGLTWIVTSTSIFAPWRVVHEERYRRRAEELLNNTIRKMPNDHPMRWKHIRRYEWLVALAEGPSCRMCVGFWIYAAAGVLAWVLMGCPAVLWGAQAWFTVPSAAVGGWWLFVLAAPRLDPAPQSPPVTIVK